MRSELRSQTVSELERDGVLLVQDGNHGEYRPRRDEIVPTGTVHIRAADIDEWGTIDFDGAQRINQVALARIRKGIGEGGDILLTHKGTIGRVGRVPWEAPSFVCSPQTTFWRSLDPDRLDRNYLYAYLRSPHFAAQLRTRMHDSDMAPYVSLTAQRSFSVPLLSIEEQRRVGALLAALDDKIDSNRRLAAHNEALATTLFEARFLRFSNADARAESEMRPIPAGWKTCPFSEAVDVNPKVRIPKGERRPFVEMAAVAPWAVRPSRLSSRAADGGCRFEPGDTLMARITGCIENGKGAFVDFLEEGGTGSTEFFVLRARWPLTPETIFLYSRSERLRAHAIANMAGTSGRQRVVRACFDDFMIAVPPDADTCRDVTDMFAASFRTSLALWRERQTLARVRDALLPKLISGEIRVPDTADPEEVIGPAVEGTAAA